MSKGKKDLIHIENIVSGDRLSEEYIYNKYRDIIHKYITFKYPNNEYTDDDVSEILIKVFNNIKKFNSKKSSFHTWVLNITRNHMIDQSRTVKKSFYQNVGHGEDSFMFSTHYTSTMTMPDTLLESKDTLEFISSSVNPNDFNILCMKYLDGFNYNEIGQEFNTSSTTISNRVHYVKSKLKNGKGNKTFTIE